MEDTGSGIVAPNGQPVRDETEDGLKHGLQLAIQRQRIEEAKFAMLVELTEAVERIPDMMLAVAAVVLGPEKARRIRGAVNDLEQQRAALREENDGEAIDRIKRGEGVQR